MSHLIAIIFDNEDEAGQVRETLKKEEHGGYISLEDSAVVVRDEQGKLYIKNEIDRGVKVGTVWGSVIGLLIGGLFLPLFGLAVGAIGGAIVGRIAGQHVESDFVEEVSETMQPGSSAIFFIFRGEDPRVAIASFRPYKGKVIQTTLSEEAEESLRMELNKRIS